MRLIRQASGVDLCQKDAMQLPAFPLGDRSAIVITGKERTSWLNGLVTSDVSKLAPGKAQYGLLVEKKGRIQTDFFAVASEDALALAVPRDLRDSVIATLDHHLIMEDAELGTPELHWFYSSSPVDGSAFSGVIGLFAEGDAIVATTEPLANAGDAKTFDALCIERGLPRFGAELDATMYPQEANLEKLAVSFDKGCYLGQEVVYMLENRGHVKKKLVPLDLEGDAPAGAGAAVTTAEGEAVGEVKSSVLGPTKKTPVAIAMVKWAQSKPGTALLVDGRKATVRAFP
jgi:folate-binding protein YgfZ